MPLKFSKNKKRVYLDYASGAPALPIVLNSSKNLEKQFFANPSSIHQDGVRSKKALENARGEIAKFFDAHADEIIFTSGGTESNAIALRGVFEYAKSQPEFLNKKPHIVTTKIEHPSVLKTCEILEKNGVHITYVSVDESGLVSPKSIYEVLTPETILVSVAYANNEIGTIQPIKEIAKEIRRYKKNNKDSNQYPVFHTDACQAIQYLDIGVERLGVDLLSWNGTKIGGPRGIGALYIKRNSPISAIYSGGEQEGGIRSGTENVPAIIGFANTLNQSRSKFQKEYNRVLEIRDYCLSQTNKKFENVRINGSTSDRLPNNINISFENFTSELLVLELDAKGISVSAGSACSSTKDAGSHVLAALYGNEDEKKWGSIRISLGNETKKQDIDLLIKSLTVIFDKYNKAGIL
jgi:cysteine desulfurase